MHGVPRAGGELTAVPGALSPVAVALSPVGVAADGGGIFFISGVPFWVIYAAAFTIVFCRAQGTYWLGRGVARGTVRTRWAGRLEGDRVQRAIGTIHRWGPVAVTLSFFTVGVQTVINLTAGYIRMPFPRYLLALVPGCAIWAAIWSTIGTAAFNGAVALAATSPLGLTVIVVGVLGLGLWVWLAVRRRRSAPAAARASASDDGDPPVN